MRFTPTCVGKTLGTYGVFWHSTDHPHMRGENCMTRAQSSKMSGSPPHAWGKCPRHGSVYPRVYGGTNSSGKRYPYLQGLSPRVRGNREAFDLTGDPIGSIPACTGEPRTAAPRQNPGQVYPRVYGGTPFFFFPRPPFFGLSPRVRGNLIRLPSRPALGWSIPACTGEPCRTRPSISSEEVYPRVYGGTAWTPAR